MAEQEQNVLQQLIGGLPGWKASFEELRARIGWPGAVLLLLGAAGGVIWWKWDDIEKRPLVKLAIKRFKRRAIPTAPAGHLTIAVAHLGNPNKAIDIMTPSIVSSMAS